MIERDEMRTKQEDREKNVVTVGVCTEGWWDERERRKYRV